MASQWKLKNQELNLGEKDLPPVNPGTAAMTALQRYTLYHS